jgi:FeS assembly SUF system regulator
MIRMTRLTDYGILLLTLFAKDAAKGLHSARGLAGETHLPLPTVSKVLKALAKHGLLEAHRGVKGGFTLSRRPEDINVAEIIDAFEGPIGVTDCTSVDTPCCDVERTCGTREHWKRINRVVIDALRGVTLAEMARPAIPAAAPVEFRVRAKV